MITNHFTEWEHDIRNYCDANLLDFDKAKSLGKCCGFNTLALVYHDPEKGQLGLLDDTPSPAALLVTKKQDGTLCFQQTEYTHRCLGLNS